MRSSIVSALCAGVRSSNYRPLAINLSTRKRDFLIPRRFRSHTIITRQLAKNELIHILAVLNFRNKSCSSKPYGSFGTIIRSLSGYLINEIIDLKCKRFNFNWNFSLPCGRLIFKFKLKNHSTEEQIQSNLSLSYIIEFRQE